MYILYTSYFNLFFEFEEKIKGKATTYLAFFDNDYSNHKQLVYLYNQVI